MFDPGVFWSTSTGLATFLELPEDATGVITNACSGDGSVIVGGYYDATANPVACRWDDGALTVLASITGADHSWAVQCSQDASIIIGMNGTHSVYWSDGGATGHLLPWPVDGGQSDVKQCSDDGTIIVGTIATNDGVRHAVIWNNGVLTMLPNSVSDSSAFILNCSFDASVTPGWLLRNHPAFGEGDVPCYWQGTTLYLLDAGGNINVRPVGVSGDGTVIYGYVHDTNTSCYWTNIHSSSGGVYGTFHALTELGQTGAPPMTFAYSGTIAGGRTSTDGSTPSSTGTRWANFVPTLLQSLPSWTFSIAGFGGPANPVISGDGTILAGVFTDDAGQFACFWDADGNAQSLEVPDGYSWTGAYGISRDGSVIYGWAHPAPPAPALKLVSLYPMGEGDVYAFTNDTNADFPSSFSQFSISVWCCEHVNIRMPNGPDAPFFLDMRLSPSQAVIQFIDDSQGKRFSGTFNNPGVVSDLYHVMFSVDTETESYTMWVSGVQWTTTDAAFT